MRRPGCASTVYPPSELGSVVAFAKPAPGSIACEASSGWVERASTSPLGVLTSPFTFGVRTTAICTGIGVELSPLLVRFTSSR